MASTPVDVVCGRQRASIAQELDGSREMDSDELPNRV